MPGLVGVELVFASARLLLGDHGDDTHEEEEDCDHDLIAQQGDSRNISDQGRPYHLKDRDSVVCECKVSIHAP